MNLKNTINIQARPIIKSGNFFQLKNLAAK
jgi:hypothetical protein